MRIKNLVASSDCVQDFCKVMPFSSRQAQQTQSIFFVEGSVWFILVINVAKVLIMLTL